jgi:hypothetical protein
MRPWHFGNTTVRSAFRLRDGLIALADSPLVGDIKGRDQEAAFARLLDDRGVVAMSEQADVPSLGRKWRAALTQLGFLVPDVSRVDSVDQSAIGAPFTITESGRRLILAEAVPAMQECFLRSLAAYRIPSAVETGYDVAPFCPLRHTLAVMLELEQRTGDSRIAFIEMAVIVELTSGEDAVADIADRVLALRTARDASANKRRFDNEQCETAGQANGRAGSTFRDYADTNFRYLKATGLVQSRGRGVGIVPEKRLLVTQLVSEVLPPLTDQEYLAQLIRGAALPTDNRDAASLVLEDLLQNARIRGIDFDLAGRVLDTAADIAVVRFELEALINENKEEAFAADQANAVEEISAYLRLIAERGTSATLSDGSSVSVPRSEAPAYFEWAMWRAFLAMDSLANKPYEARRFKIDQDFMPISCAPGGGPDLIFEFDDFVVVVEVTLTESSRQEAAEGEPVRRHVADIARDHALRGTGKTVYGLFLANRIDSNTAETFRIGVWYLPDDTRTQLDIVPVSTSAFSEFFDAVFAGDLNGHATLRQGLDDAIMLRDGDGGAPAWKAQVDHIIRWVGDVA